MMKSVMELPDREIMDHWINAGMYEYLGSFPWHATENAPNTFKALKQWARDHKFGVDSMPVFNGSSDKAIYSRSGNFKFRAWHDAIHIKENLSFSYQDEIKVSNIHCQILRYLNAPYNVIKAVQADVEGQARYYYITGEYVNKQSDFVADCLTYGIETVLTFVSKGAKY